MRKFGMLAALALTLVMSQSASAALINGSFGFAGLVTTINGDDLGDSSLFSPLALIVTDPDLLGDYFPMPLLAGGTGGTINTTNLAAFTVSFGTYGTFTTSVGQILLQETNFLNAYFLGTFTPGPGLLGPLPLLEPSPTSVRVSITRTGNTNSYSGTLASPPEDITEVPEPGTYAMIGAGLVGLFALRRKRA